VPCLPAKIQLQHLRDQADSLLRDAGSGDRAALERIRAVSDTPTIADSELALAREYGFADWSRLELEVRRREVLNSRDLNRLAALLANHPELAYTPLEHWCDHKHAGTIAYMAMLRFDRERLGLPRELPGTGAVVDALAAAGATPDGIESAAAAGDISGWLNGDTPVDARIRALVMAADHQRLDVIDQLLDAGTPIDADDDYGRQPLRTAAQNGRSASVEHLLARGADPRALEGLSETDG
jgi:hypothetical protein